MTTEEAHEQVIRELQENGDLWSILEDDPKLKATLVDLLKEIVRKEDEVRERQQLRLDKEQSFFGRLLTTFSAA